MMVMRMITMVEGMTRMEEEAMETHRSKITSEALEAEECSCRIVAEGAWPKDLQEEADTASEE